MLPCSHTPVIILLRNLSECESIPFFMSIICILSL
nr:MAG TPA: hypothetical protein [Caudoviricetes sp.]